MPAASRLAPAAFLSFALLAACSDEPAPSGPNTPQPHTIRVSYCDGNEPAWVAFQDGDGAWTRAMPVATGDTVTYQYVFQADHAGIATLMRGGSGLTSLVVLYSSPTEIGTAGNTKTLYCGDPVSKTLLGTVAGLDTNEVAAIGGHLSHITAPPIPNDTFALSGLGSGPHDLFGARHTRSGGQTTLTRVIVRRGVDVPDSTTVPVFDFASAEAFPPLTQTLTVSGLGPEGASAAVRVLTRTTEALLSPVPSASPDVMRPYAALPVAQLRGDDIQELLVSAVSGSVSRSTRFYFLAPASRTLALPAPLTRPTIDTVAKTPALRLRARFVAQADFDREASMNYQQGTTTIVTVSMTAAYASLFASGYELVVPDLSGVAGFDPAWALHPGSPVIWIAGRVGGTLGRGVNVIPGEGSLRRDAFDIDTLP